MIDIFEKCSNPAKVIFFSPPPIKHYIKIKMIDILEKPPNPPKLNFFSPPPIKPYTKIKMIDILGKPPNPPKMNFLPKTHIKLPQTKKTNSMKFQYILTQQMMENKKKNV